MKKQRCDFFIRFSFLLSGMVMLLFVSCKKDHTCVCGDRINGVSSTVHATRSKAKKECTAMEKVFDSNCRLE